MKKKATAPLLLVSIMLSVGITGAADGSPNTAPLDRGGEFHTGADISLLHKIEDHGGIYQVNGNRPDPLEIFKGHC